MTESSSTAAAPPRGPEAPIGRLVDVGDRRLWLHRSGTGEPAVVFLPGAGLVGLDFLNLHDRVAAFTTSVIYDRAGTGWSSRIDLPRTAREVSDELRALLDAAGVPAPHVLVGHSLGGAYARDYAQRFPGDVAGLVLLDPFHEDLVARAPGHVRAMLERFKNPTLPEPTPEQIERSRAPLVQHFASWPDGVRQALVEYHLTSWRIGWDEGRNLYDEVTEELRHAAPLPDVPLFVLSALGRDATQASLWSPEVLEDINRAKAALHATLAASLPRGQHRSLGDAGHGWIHEESPEAVLDAIAAVVGKV